MASWIDNIKEAFGPERAPNTRAVLAQMGSGMLAGNRKMAGWKGMADALASINQGDITARNTGKGKSVQDYVEEFSKVMTPIEQPGITSISRGDKDFTVKVTPKSAAEAAAQSAGGAPVQSQVKVPVGAPAGGPAAQHLANQTPAPVAQAAAQPAQTPAPAPVARPARNPMLGLTPAQVMAARAFQQNQRQNSIKTAGDLITARDANQRFNAGNPLRSAQTEQALASAAASRASTALTTRTVKAEIGGKTVELTVPELMSKYKVDQQSAVTMANNTAAMDRLEKQLEDTRAQRKLVETNSTLDRALKEKEIEINRQLKLAAQENNRILKELDVDIKRQGVEVKQRAEETRRDDNTIKRQAAVDEAYARVEGNDASRGDVSTINRDTSQWPMYVWDDGEAVAITPSPGDTYKGMPLTPESVRKIAGSDVEGFLRAYRDAKKGK